MVGDDAMKAGDRMIRLLSIIPWVARHADGAPIEEVVTRFAYPRDQLLHDLTEVVFFVGVYPFTPDVLIEVEISDDRVQIRYADWFSRPLRLTKVEAAQLLTVCKSVLELTGESGVGPADSPGPAGEVPPVDDIYDESGSLVRALIKLATSIGERADRVLDIHIGSAPDKVVELLRCAIAERRRVEMDYHSFGRDEFTVRGVDPHHLFNDTGRWYLSGWCHRAEGVRLFRVDRIRSATLADATFAESQTDVTGLSGRAAFSAPEDHPLVRLRLDRSQRWVLEYPVDEITETDEGLYVTVAVGGVAWLERLLLRLGPAAEIMQLDAEVPADIRSAAAMRVLARYGK